jgi:phage shock protein PspC (stress-responsive transcriptional regulator)
MKKNITINLCGRLFQIDEDAYEMLQHYIDSLRSHFGRQAEGNEIVNDIEERIAELFDELQTRGTMAINIEHVKDIITRIGKPEQMDDNEGQTPNDSEEAHRSKQQSSGNAFDDLRSSGKKAYESFRASTVGKRLYRNPNDKIVFGVLSGLAAYTNTSAILWRLFAVIFTLFYGVGFIIYLVMALIIPEARTPEQRLQMEGKEVNPQNLADMVIDDKETKPAESTPLREIISVLFKIVVAFFVVIACIVGGALAIAFLGILMTTVFAFIMPASSAIALPFTLSGMGLTEIWQEHPAMLITLVLALLLVLFIPVYAITHMVLSLSKKIKPMGIGQRIGWIVLWLIALCTLIPLGSTVGWLHDEYRHQRWGNINVKIDVEQEPQEEGELTDSMSITAFSDTLSTDTQNVGKERRENNGFSTRKQ